MKLIGGSTDTVGTRFEEIAALMGVKWQAVQGIHHRAMDTLRRRHAD